MIYTLLICVYTTPWLFLTASLSLSMNGDVCVLRNLSFSLSFPPLSHSPGGKVNIIAVTRKIRTCNKRSNKVGYRLG